MITRHIVEKLLDSEFLNDFRPSSEQVTLVDRLITSGGNENLCELLLSHAPLDYNNDKLAAFISMLIWQTPDNGTQVIETLEMWASSSDLRKVRIANSDRIEVQLKNAKRTR